MAPVWCPYLVKDIHTLENVQRIASRLALNQRKGDMSYEDRCKLLKWPTLSDRRTFLSLVEFYKIIFFFRSTRGNHQYKLYVKPARLNCYKHSVFVRIVKLWNELPGDIVEADSFQHFKSKLKLYLTI